MKVLIVPSWYPTKENPLKGVFFKEQTEALNKHGVDVRIAYVHFMSLKDILRNRVKIGLTQSIENGIKVYRYNTYNFFPKPYGLSVRYYTYAMNKTVSAAISDGWRPQLFHVHSVLMAGFAIKALSKKYRIPYILTEHSSIFGRKLFAKQHVKFIKSALRDSSAVIAVSEGLKKDLGTFMDQNLIQVIPNICSFGSEKNSSFHKDINKDKFTFFSLALLTQNKGMDVLIKAFYNQFKGDRNVTLRIGGDGSEHNNLKKLIDESGLEDQVILLGSLDRNEVAQEMNNCSCFVLASRYETFGVVFTEALSFGKPVIATRCGGPEGIVDNSNGLLVDVDDTDGLSKAMLNMKNNISRYDSESIIEYCRDKFGEDAVIDQIKKVYNKFETEEKF